MAKGELVPKCKQCTEEAGKTVRHRLNEPHQFRGEAEPAAIEPTGIVLLDRAQTALADAHSIEEVADVRNQAEAVRRYLKTQRAGLRMQNQAAVIKLRAERRLGELLADMDKRRPGPVAGDRSHDAIDLRPTMADLGITLSSSSRWQREASVPEEDFLRFVAETTEQMVEVTALALLRLEKARRDEAARRANAARVAGTEPLAGPSRYRTIVIDPPWDWGDEGDESQFGRGRPRYATLALSELEALTIPVNGDSVAIADLAETDAHLYLWITNRSLPKGFGLLEAWGFRYVTLLTWVKPSFGMGNYFRGSTEHVLFGVRGSLGLLRQDAGTHFEAPRPGDAHSAKPDEFYELVETCSPGPWADLFARKQRGGWFSWGAEL